MPNAQRPMPNAQCPFCATGASGVLPGDERRRNTATALSQTTLKVRVRVRVRVGVRVSDCTQPDYPQGPPAHAPPTLALSRSLSLTVDPDPYSGPDHNPDPGPDPQVIPHKHFQVLMKDNHFLKVSGGVLQYVSMSVGQFVSEKVTTGDTSCTASTYLLPPGRAARQALAVTLPLTRRLCTPSTHRNPTPNQAGLHAKHVLSKKQGQKVTAGRGLDEDEERDEIVLKQRRK